MIERVSLKCLVMFSLLAATACSTATEHARTSAVQDGMRALGLAKMQDGSYEFRLCTLEKSYTYAVLEEKCINPLTAEDGLPLVFTEVPGKPGTLVARGWNWGITLVAALASGVAVYGIGRYAVKLFAARSLGGEAYVASLEKALKASGGYEHFKLPELQGSLIDENLNIVEKLKLASGRTVEIRRLLTERRMQTKVWQRKFWPWHRITGGKLLDDSEKAEVNRLLIQLEESLKSGSDYVQRLETGLKTLDKQEMSLPEEIAAITHKHDSELRLNDDILVPLLKNRPVATKYHKSLQQLDEQVTDILKRAAPSLASKELRVARLEAATGFNEVLKSVEEAGEDALIKAQHDGDNALKALTKGRLNEMLTELKEIVDNGDNSVDQVRQKIDTLHKEVRDSVAAWQAMEAAEGLTDIDGVVRSVSVFIRDTRNRTIRVWRNTAKEQNKELKKIFNTSPRAKAEVYENTAREAINSTDSIKRNPAIDAAGTDLLASIERIVAGAVKHTGEEQGRLTNSVHAMRIELDEVIRGSNNIADVKSEASKIVQRTENIDLPGENGASIRASILEEIDKLPEHSEDGGAGFFRRAFDALRNFSFKESKIFRYWEEGAERKAAITVRNREQVVDNLANNEVVGEVKVEKGIEKLLGHLVGTATIVALPTTSLRQKLPGSARISAAKHWDSLTSNYDLATAASISDMHTIIAGIAAATGARVSDEVFYFLLRSGLTSR